MKAIKPPSKYSFCCIFLLSIYVLFFSLIRQTKAAVTLLYFRGMNVNDVSVRLEWATANESGTLGFLVYRKDLVGGEYQLISQFIDSQGELTGATYEYLDDTDIVAGNTYWYKLQEVDSGNNLIDRAFTSVGIGLQKTYTSTPTLTATSTATKTSMESKTSTPTSTTTKTATRTAPVGTSKTSTSTPTNPSKTATKTPRSSGSSGIKSPTATNSGLTKQNTTIATLPRYTSLPSNPQLNSTSTDSSQAQDTLQSGDILSNPEDGTPTLEPLPSLALIFPATPAPAQPDISSPTPEKSSVGGMSHWISGKGLTVIGVIVVLWLVLGGWFLYSFRRME